MPLIKILRIRIPEIKYSERLALILLYLKYYQTVFTSIYAKKFCLIMLLMIG